jgi:hypothetical protein
MASAGQPIGASGPIAVGLLGGVAEDEPATALTAGVHDRSLGRWRKLLEHLGAQALDVLNDETPEAAAGKVSGAEYAARLPVADRVLVHAERSGCVADVQQFSRSHDSPTIAIDVVFVDYVDFVHLTSSADPIFS